MKKNIILLVCVIIPAFSCSVQANSCSNGTEPTKIIRYNADGMYYDYICGNQNVFTGGSTVKANEIKFPGKFYTTDLKSCEAIGEHMTFDEEWVIQHVDGLIGFDWHTHHHLNSSSVNVRHKPITGPMKTLMGATHNAIGNNNKTNIDIAKNYLVELARTKTLYDSIGRTKVRKKPSCSATWGTSKACWYHEYEFARQAFTNYMITAVWLKDELNNQDNIIVSNYIKDMYIKFVKQDKLSDETGIYAFANGGVARLLYASWINNTDLAAKEFNQRFAEFKEHIFDDGYIDNNSFRGNKGQFYHSYGLDIILGYVYIAELWGVEIPADLQVKLVKASKLVNLAITDPKKFYSRPYPYGIAKGQVKKGDPLNMFGPAYTHPAAIAIDTLMYKMTGIELEYDPIYLSRRSNNSGIDDLIGFNANCIK